MEDIIKDFSRKEAEIFANFDKKYRTQYANEPIFVVQEVLKEHLNATKKYEQESEPVYQKWENRNRISCAVWAGSLLTTAVSCLFGNGGIDALVPFCCVGGTALVGAFYCSAKQINILNHNKSNCLETLAIMGVIDDKMDALIADCRQNTTTTEPDTTRTPTQEKQ